MRLYPDERGKILTGQGGALCRRIERPSIQHSTELESMRLLGTWGWVSQRHSECYECFCGPLPITWGRCRPLHARVLHGQLKPGAEPVSREHGPRKPGADVELLAVLGSHK